MHAATRMPNSFRIGALGRGLLIHLPHAEPVQLDPDSGDEKSEGEDDDLVLDHVTKEQRHKTAGGGAGAGAGSSVEAFVPAGRRGRRPACAAPGFDVVEAVSVDAPPAPEADRCLRSWGRKQGAQQGACTSEVPLRACLWSWLACRWLPGRDPIPERRRLTGAD